MKPMVMLLVVLCGCHSPLTINRKDGSMITGGGTTGTITDHDATDMAGGGAANPDASPDELPRVTLGAPDCIGTAEQCGVKIIDGGPLNYPFWTGDGSVRSGRSSNTAGALACNSRWVFPDENAEYVGCIGEACLWACGTPEGCIVNAGYPGSPSAWMTYVYCPRDGGRRICNAQDPDMNCTWPPPGMDAAKSRD